MNTKQLIEQARIMAKQEPINGALWGALADKLEEATVKNIKTLTVEIDVDFLGKTAPELVNEIKAQGIRDSIEYADKLTEESKDNFEWINQVYKYANKLEQGK